MRIVHFRTGNFFGGPEAQIVGHAIACRDTDMEIVMGAILRRGERSALIERASKEGLPNAAVEWTGTLPMTVGGLLKNRLLELAADVVCTHDYRSSVLVALSGVHRYIPWVPFSRGFTSEGVKNALWQRLEVACMRRAHRIVAVSGSQARLLEDLGVPAGRINIVLNAANLSGATASNDGRTMLRDELGLPKESMLVVSAGRFTPEKGQSVLVEAAVEVSRQYPDLYFVLFGDGPLRASCTELAARKGLAGRVLFPGFRSDVRAVIGQADIVVNASLTEGLPNVLLEAMAASRPVVATAVGGVPELIDSDTCGILVPSGSSADLARAIGALIKDQETRRAIGEAARRRVEDHFTFDGQRHRLRAVYDSVLGSPRL